MAKRMKAMYQLDVSFCDGVTRRGLAAVEVAIEDGFLNVVSDHLEPGYDPLMDALYEEDGFDDDGVSVSSLGSDDD